MKFKPIAAIVAAAGLSLVTALSLTTAGSAAAAPLAQPKQHKPAPPPQVTGNRLQSALLPGSAFGDGFTASDLHSTGRRLLSTRAFLNVPRMSCSNFEAFFYYAGFGNTAGTIGFETNPNPFPAYPNTVLYGAQNVLQFASTKTATSFFGQERAKYSACQSFSEPNPGDTNPGGGRLEVTTMSVAKTTISRDQAFVVTQLVDLSEIPGLTFYNNTLVVLAGTNVYEFWNLSGTNDEPSPALMAKLISRTQALYLHHR